MHRPDIKKTIEMALLTLGLTEDFLYEQLNINIPLHTNNDYLRMPFHLIHNIFNCLHLDDSFYQTDYRRDKHLKLICFHIEQGNFTFKKSQHIRTAWRNYKKNRRNTESNYYGLKLRWRIRFKRFIYGGK